MIHKIRLIQFRKYLLLCYKNNEKRRNSGGKE